MDHLKTLLRQFAFSDIETDVYIAALSLGPCGVADIAEKMSKNRTAIYFHIKNLLQKGILKESRKGRKIRYVALPPTELADHFSRITTDFKSLVPQLESLFKVEKEIPLIEVTESTRGYFKVYDEISSLPVGSTFRVLEGKDALVKEFALLSEEEWRIFFTRAAERKIETRGIFTKESLRVPTQALSSENFKNIGERIWHLRTLPESILPFQQLLFIYGEKIAFLFPDSSLVVTIKHKDIANSLAAVFDGLFHFATIIPKGWKTDFAKEEI